jgi:hypothetical protein
LLIPQNMSERVAIFGPQSFEAHRPSWGKLPRMAGKSFPHPENLALSATTTVDSFYGSVNTDDVGDLYPHLNQVALEWSPRPERGCVDLRLATFTPNFRAFRWRFDQGPWQSGLDTVLAWPLHPGHNTVEVQAMNSAGRAGRASRLRLVYEPNGETSWAQDLAVAEFRNGVAVPTKMPFLWEDYRHPRLTTLRERYRLDEVIAGATSDLERVVRLRDWVKSRWDHQQPITLPPWDALYILERVDKKIEAFYCVHYSVTFMQCCLSLGIPARLVNLHRGLPPAGIDDITRGSELYATSDPPCDEHVVNEVWLDDQGRWAMMDVDFDIHYEREGVPLSALEIHRTLLAGELAAVQVREGPYAYKLKADDRFYQFHLPTYYAHFCVFWRNNHLSDPEGPTQIWHWVDEKTPPMLWWEGSDLRHRPHIIGPTLGSWPYSQRTPRLTDGNIATCWASAETPAPHWVELQWPRPVTFSQVFVDWAECWRRYWTSTAYHLQVWQDGTWREVASATGNPETACNHHTFPPVTTDRLRLWQPIGGGPAERPNILWLAELEVYA